MGEKPADREQAHSSDGGRGVLLEYNGMLEVWMWGVCELQSLSAAPSVCGYGHSLCMRVLSLLCILRD